MKKKENMKTIAAVIMLRIPMSQVYPVTLITLNLILNFYLEYTEWIQNIVGDSELYRYPGGDKCSCGKRTSQVSSLVKSSYDS